MIQDFFCVKNSLLYLMKKTKNFDPCMYSFKKLQDLISCHGHFFTENLNFLTYVFNFDTDFTKS